MALQIPNIYTLGQVQVSTQPLAQLQGKLLAEQQAKLEAVDRYFEKQIGALDREGIAENDVPDYEQGIAALNTYWQQNKDDIRRGGMAKMNFDKLIQEQKNFVYQSKKKASQVYDLRKQYQFGGKTPTDSDMTILDKIALPLKSLDRINPATGRPYGIEDLSMQVPSFDLNRRNSWFNGISSGVDIENGVGKKIKSKTLPNGETEETYEFTYSPAQLKFMQTKAVQALPADRTALTYYENILANPNVPENQDRLKRLNEAWVNSGLYPNQEMKTASDLAMADVLLEYGFKPPVIKTKIIPARPRVSTGGGVPSGPKNKLEDYFILNRYTNTESIPNSGGQKGIKASNVNAVDRKLLDRFMQPAFINNEEWYIVSRPGEWIGEDNKYITDVKLAIEGGLAPQSVVNEYLQRNPGGRRRTSVKY